jgi:hypothetical protein
MDMKDLEKMHNFDIKVIVGITMYNISMKDNDMYVYIFIYIYVYVYTHRCMYMHSCMHLYTFILTNIYI